MWASPGSHTGGSSTVRAVPYRSGVSRLVVMAWRRISPEPDKVLDPRRKHLPDDSSIVRTHSDLHRSNIILTATTSARVVSIVDWNKLDHIPTIGTIARRRILWVTGKIGEGVGGSTRFFLHVPSQWRLGASSAAALEGSDCQRCCGATVSYQLNMGLNMM
jgi:hypothetical protein